ncbi:hypothetical protein Scep_000887 [Stephania cephalantha]|uniref:Gfo/Idh/MocA-like oxidoreductase N-terminal domain-containing protein n=1 Tax=Stephania cephalantha TaxID=152367 RepID=A0AAP0L749_9MAGN
MGETPIRFGILGCASIARKVSRAISLSTNATVFAIGSRSVEKAQKYVSANAFIPPSVKIYGSYEAVLDDPEVDAVYVPLPTSLHLQWAVLAAEKSKHVLLEKPVALNAAEFDRIVSACEANGVQFMDGTMWMHHPRTALMREFIADPVRFGSPKSIHSTFTFTADPEFLKNNIRAKPDLDALGALGDLGWYCARAILWAVDYELPKTVTAIKGTVFNEAGVILSCGASLLWEDGKVATFHCSFLSNTTMNITTTGTVGTLHVDDFVIPCAETSSSFLTSTKTGFSELDTEWKPLPSEHVVTNELPQEALMVKEFARLVKGIKEGSLKAESKWPVYGRKTQLVLDRVIESIERGYESVEVVD